MLVLDDISIRVAGRLLLDGASVRIPAGARVGLVGRNGIGKTTLFRAITHELPLEHGAIEMPARARIGRLAQEAPGGPERLIDVVLAADSERTELLAEAETAHDPHRIAEIQTRLADIGAHAAPARAAEILAGPRLRPGRAAAPVLGFLRRLAHARRARRPCCSPSRTCCCSTSRPTISISKARCGCTDHLARYPRTVIVISHDRDLLDDAVDWIMHLEGGKLTLYRGGYTSFARQRAERMALDAKAAKKQELERKKLQAFIDRFKAKATKARQAQSRAKRLAKLEPIAAMTNDEVRPIVFPPPAKPLSPPIVALEKVAVGYEPGKPVLRRLSLRIDPDDRIALLGPNGNGKSTLAKLLAARLAPDSGIVTRAERMEVAYFAQHQLDELVPEQSVYEHVRALMPDAPEAKVRARAGNIGFSGERADTPVENLSGGEKARLLLGLATFARPASRHPRRADQPSRHRQPRRAGRGDQRISRRRDPDLARPLSDRGLRRPALAGRRRHGRAVRRRSRRLPPPRARARGEARRSAKKPTRSRAPTSAAPRRRSARSSSRSSAASMRPRRRSRSSPPTSRRSTRSLPTACSRAIPPRRPRSPRRAPKPPMRSRKPRKTG